MSELVFRCLLGAAAGFGLGALVFVVLVSLVGPLVTAVVGAAGLTGLYFVARRLGVWDTLEA